MGLSMFLATMAISVSHAADGQANAKNELAPVDAYDYVLGTQTFSPKYHFTDKNRLVETAEAIRDMGSNTIKCHLGVKVYSKGMYDLPNKPEHSTMKKTLDTDPSFRAVLRMPFAYYLFWAYPHAAGDAHEWHDGLSADEAQYEYDEMHELACYLLQEFNHSKKTFLLGHWEGDWALLGGFDKNKEPDPTAIQGMIDWLSVRQKAIDDAKREVSHEGVDVFHYTEVNLVRKAIAGGRTVANDVLPKTTVDYVSYSSYDSLELDEGPDAMQARLRESLGYIESKLPPKDIRGKRVFIGEYGFALHRMKTAEAQNNAARLVAETALEWGCPFALYWQMYDNEAEEGGANAKGYWMIDNTGEKQPVYFTHKRFLSRAREFVADYRMRQGADPSPETYRAAGVNWLRDSQP